MATNDDVAFRVCVSAATQSAFVNGTACVDRPLEARVEAAIHLSNGPHVQRAAGVVLHTREAPAGTSRRRMPITIPLRASARIGASCGTLLRTRRPVPMPPADTEEVLA